MVAPYSIRPAASCSSVKVSSPQAGTPVFGLTRTVLAEAVLDDLDLLVVPVLPERRQDPAVPHAVAVDVGRTFPRADGGEVRRLLGGGHATGSSRSS